MLDDLFIVDIKLLLAVIGAVTAFFQWRKLVAEKSSFRQQIISLLHHSEGVMNSARQVLYDAREGKYSSVKDLEAGVGSVVVNAEALFFGLIESKVGGSPLKDDLDKKYSEWADLELERKNFH